MLTRIFQFTAPLILAGLVLLFGVLTQYLQIWPEFSAIQILAVVIAPLAELYYLWQRPVQYRYPIILSVALLSFHACLGLENYLQRTGQAEEAVLDSVSLHGWLEGATVAWAGAIMIMYFLRTYYKKPRRGIDGVKAGLVTLFFGSYVIGALGNVVRLEAFTDLDNLRRWLSLLVMMSGGLFVITHLIDVLLLPPAVPDMPHYEALIDEIQQEEEG